MVIKSKTQTALQSNLNLFFRLSQTCNHIAAVLLYLQQCDELPCTSQLCTWDMPSHKLLQDRPEHLVPVCEMIFKKSSATSGMS